MTDIDPQADIEVHPDDEHMTVRMPVAGPVTGEWLRYFRKLALAAEVPRSVMGSPGGRGTAAGGHRRPGSRSHRPSVDRRRALSLGLVAVLVADAAGVTGRLVVDLVEGGLETNSATDLLKVGFLIWLYTIIAFSFLYWVLDGGGAESRFLAPPEFPDLAFPEQLNPGAAPPGWRPEVFDYLYLGFTDATAFSPTDVMPLARWGKLAMTVQAICSLMILGLVIESH
jgi:hypothetical protein